MHLKPPITKRNLLYFILPVANNDVWQKNLNQLTRRLQQFNGKKIMVIATADFCVPAQQVMDYVQPHAFEFAVVVNDPVQRERNHVLAQLETLFSLDPNEATFYAHAKGVTRAADPQKNQAVTYWRNLMYHKLLDDPNLIGHLLRRFCMVGTHRKLRRTRMPGHIPFMVNWHFSGTFWWFRHDALFSRNWRSLPPSAWAIEGLPGLLFSPHECYCLIKENIANPYNPDSYGPGERIED